MADANENRDWRIYADFAQVLIAEARGLYADEDFGVELDNTVYALDASTIDLCRPSTTVASGPANLRTMNCSFCCCEESWNNIAVILAKMFQDSYRKVE